MNERVRELIRQTDFIDTELLTEPQTIMLEKFAELMAKKFDDILLLEYLDCVGNQNDQGAMRIQLLRARVKIYFGVDE